MNVFKLFQTVRKTKENNHKTSLLYIHLCDIIKKTRREKNHVDKVVENFPAVLKCSIEMFFIFDRVRYTFNSRQITRGCKTC